MRIFKFYLLVALALFILAPAISQSSISGLVTTDGVAVAYASVQLKGLSKGTSSDSLGKFILKEVPRGRYTLVISAVGFTPAEETININSDAQRTVYVSLQPVQLLFDELVVTGTRTFKRKTESAVIVNVLDSKTLTNLQVCNLSESLKFQPGLRVETDCQTCNYTQLRMNGLAGGYSQILINGRPIFSPLMSLYGLEQLPVNMIERIEVIRGGGSSLYGSSAIGGTVNVITKIPAKNAYEVNSFYQNTGGQTSDYVLNANGTLVTKKKDAGVSFFLNHRQRGLYDANGDNFSELPQLTNNAAGANFFYKPKYNQKLEVSISNLREYRYGGEMVNKPAYLALQSEERDHNIWMGNVDYQINFNDNKSSFITYAAWQHTKRDHYTGILPDSAADVLKHVSAPPYGNSKTTTLQGGFQLNHTISKFIGGDNVLTLGSEYLSDKVFDQIPAYRYLVDQHSKNWGTFIQSDWAVTPQFNILSGIRMDHHNLVDHVVFSPRVALLYKLKSTTQLRLSYGTGFRAPQAFDTDLHIAFAGGGVSRVQLAPNLQQERSRSLSASVNYDKATENFIAGFTLEGFYTNLKNAFVLTNIGQDNFGNIFQKQNNDGASVAGITTELRANYKRKIQLESGFTFQLSRFKEAVENIQGVAPTKTFLRTPNAYGFSNLNITATKNLNININYVFTGPMELAHFGGANNFPNDQMVTSRSFSEVNSRIGYTFDIHKALCDLEIYGGVKNIFNAYQTDFDKGKNRDSNYVYGPAQPRTVFIGIRIKSE